MTDRPARRGIARLAVDVRLLTQSRDFRLLWTGQAVSFLGSMVTFVAVPYQLYALTGSTLAVGLLSLADAIPLLVFGAVGGTIADHPQVWALYVLAALGTSLWSLGSPALRALMPGLVPPEQYAAASALQSIYYNFGAVVGPALGGLLIAGAGLTTTYLVDVGSFSASLFSSPWSPRDLRRRGWSGPGSPRCSRASASYGARRSFSAPCCSTRTR